MTVEEFKTELTKLMIELIKSQKSLIKEIAVNNQIIDGYPDKNLMGNTDIKITFA